MPRREYTNQERRIAFGYFRERHVSGQLQSGFKDRFLQDREEWDKLQQLLINDGLKLLHDDVKGLVTHLDKGGYLGGVSKGLTFDQVNAMVEAKRDNLKTFGHPKGIEGIRADLAVWAEKANSPLEEYYQTAGWAQRSREYRESKGWICELCLRDHSQSRHLLHAHHLSYELADGSSALHHETDRELMALCAEPCHVLADIVRMIKASKIKWPGSAETLELFKTG